MDQTEGKMKTIRKYFTDAWDICPNGTVHSYYYYNDNNKWTYSICFHINNLFQNIEITEKTRKPIQRIIEKARKELFKSNGYL